MKSEAEIMEGLRDAGCPEEDILSFMKCYRNDDLKKGLKVLGRYRRSVLERLHGEQTKIDRLDYMVYQMQRS